jgi:hypothetical protein
MKKSLVIVALLAWAVAGGAAPVSTGSQEDLAIWREFVGLLKADRLSLDRLRPMETLTPESQLALLRDFAKNAVWEEWEPPPRVIRYGSLVTFIVTLGQKNASPWTYTFNFIVDGGRWYYRFLEGIFIPLDGIGLLPAAAAGFPDLPENRKIWIQQEAYWSEQVRLFNFLTREKGKDLAFRWIETGLANGVGYALAASVWIPFYPTPRAFILYLCWEQAKLGGNKVTLEKLDEHEAVVLFEDSQYFSLYMIASHLKDQISFEDYIRIFETIWQARAKAAGWALKIDGQGRKIYFHFNR